MTTVRYKELGLYFYCYLMMVSDESITWFTRMDLHSYRMECDITLFTMTYTSCGAAVFTFPFRQSSEGNL